jgi:hypothetical protein
MAFVPGLHTDGAVVGKSGRCDALSHHWSASAYGWGQAGATSRSSQFTCIMHVDYFADVESHGEHANNGPQSAQRSAMTKPKAAVNVPQTPYPKPLKYPSSANPP